MPVVQGQFDVELPAGGRLYLQTAEEVLLWDESLARYRLEYEFQKQNDLFTLGALLQQQLVLFRAQTAINGMEPEHINGVPTGNYVRVDHSAQDLVAYQKAMTAASVEMRAMEKQLGIDKATREQGGAHTVDNYLTELKRAAHQRGVHLSKRLIAYEAFVMGLRWRLRMLFKGDKEDRAYHNISPKSVLTWCWDELKKLEEIDKAYAKQKHSVFLGKL